MRVIKSRQLRNVIGTLVPLLMIPAVIVAGAVAGGDRSYLAITLSVVILSVVLFISGIDRKRTGTRRLVLCAVMAALAVTGCCFGGYLGMFLPICSDFFGNRNITLNYGILYSAFALAGILGPLAGSLMRFSSAVLCAACISFSGLAAAVLVQAIYAGKAAVNK